MQRHATLSHLLTQCGQETRSDILMHQQRLDRVTGTRTLRFRIDDNLQRRGNLSAIVNKDMANANPAGDHRNGRLLTAQLM